MSLATKGALSLRLMVRMVRCPMLNLTQPVDTEEGWGGREGGPGTASELRALDRIYYITLGFSPGTFL